MCESLKKCETASIFLRAQEFLRDGGRHSKMATEKIRGSKTCNVEDNNTCPLYSFSMECGSLELAAKLRAREYNIMYANACIGQRLPEAPPSRNQ